MKFNFSLLSLYIIVILIVKIIYSITCLNLSYHKIFSSENIKKIEQLDLENNDLEWVFMCMIFLLIIYIFSSTTEKIIISGNLKHVLFAGGVIGVYSQLQQAHFFGLLDFLHIK